MPQTGCFSFAKGVKTSCPQVDVNMIKTARKAAAHAEPARAFADIFRASALEEGAVLCAKAHKMSGFRMGGALRERESAEQRVVLIIRGLWRQAMNRSMTKAMRMPTVRALPRRMPRRPDACPLFVENIFIAARPPTKLFFYSSPRNTRDFRRGIHAHKSKNRFIVCTIPR